MMMMVLMEWNGTEPGCSQDVVESLRASTKTCTQIIYNKYAKLFMRVSVCASMYVCLCVCVCPQREKGWIRASSRIRQEQKVAATTCRKSKTPDDKLSREQQNKRLLKTHDGRPMAGHAFVLHPNKLVCVPWASLLCHCHCSDQAGITLNENGNTTVTKID